jgi:hypothetical protein
MLAEGTFCEAADRGAPSQAEQNTVESIYRVRHRCNLCRYYTVRIAALGTRVPDMLAGREPVCRGGPSISSCR